ncbi:hypothetical protein LCGC14_1205390 [marine sediment metagenome]|uniref:Uncharacterized protein n=1 Tax=marine sediment metagenome TaxID=412755 RepID=A0A0F9NXY4_9ZZZZ
MKTDKQKSEFILMWKPLDLKWCGSEAEPIFIDNLNDLIASELTSFLDFLLKNGYCDTDVYSEPPSAIDRYMHPSLKK